jgi:hypothetical protein
MDQSSDSLPTPKGDVPVPEANPPSLDKDDAAVSEENFSKEWTQRKPFRRRPSFRLGDELKILNYSYVLSESASLRQAVAFAYNLSEIVQACFFFVIF